MAENVKFVSTDGLKQVFKSTKAYVDKQKAAAEAYADGKVQELTGQFQTAEQVAAAAADAAGKVKSEILGGAVPETLDTIKEISDWINDHGDVASALNTEIAKKANSADVYSKTEADDAFAKKANSLAGYGIADAKIAGGVITLGDQSITPITKHQSLDGYAKTADLPTFTAYTDAEIAAAADAVFDAVA